VVPSTVPSSGTNAAETTSIADYILQIEQIDRATNETTTIPDPTLACPETLLGGMAMDGVVGCSYSWTMERGAMDDG
jgi:hypothetical protein